MRVCVRLGLRVAACGATDCAVVTALGLDSSAQLMAFAWLYGCWIAGTGARVCKRVYNIR